MRLTGLRLSRLLTGFFLLMQFRNPALDLSVKLGPADLGNDGSVVGFVDLEHTSALGAFQFMHKLVIYLLV